MSVRILIMMLIFGFCGFINEVFINFFRSRYAKKSNYDCDKCTVYDCPNKECMKKRV